MRSDKKCTITVVGHKGIVGKQIYKYFKKQGYPVIGCSLDKKTHTWNEINDRTKYFFIAVPTPYDWKTAQPSLKAVRETLGRIQGRKIVIIKSTMLPGSTKELQEDYPWLKLLFNPEFLSGATAWEDFINPDRQIVGYTKKSFNHAITILNLLPESPYGAIMTATEAEITKYVNNFHGALMVIFANFFYDICQKVGADFEKVKKASIASKWVGSPMGRTYWSIFHGGYRGYGGKCFPKDINSLIRWCRDNGIDDTLIDAVKTINVKLLGSQGMTEEEVEKRNKEEQKHGKKEEKKV